MCEITVELADTFSSAEVLRKEVPVTGLLQFQIVSEESTLVAMTFKTLNAF